MIVFFLTALLSTGAPPPPDAGTQKPVAPAEFKHPVEITADKFEIRGKSQDATWVGHVKAIRGTTTLTCDRLVAHYTQAQEITHIQCLGNVEAQDGDKWAKGEKADFDNQAGVLVVTGSPEARQGQNHMKGTQVTFYVGKDLIEVQNAQIIFESQKPLKKPGAKRAPPK